MKESVYCFFGHHDANDEIKDNLRKEIRLLIINENAQKFYVGNHGHFDYMVFNILREMKSEFPNINYAVVLAYMHDRSADEYSYFAPEESLLPDRLEKVPRKLGVIWRNNWMLKQSDMVICYVWHYMGGSGQMVKKAIKQGKKVVNLAKM